MSEIRCNAGQSFDTWFRNNFNEEFKKKEADAIRRGLMQLKRDTVSNVLKSGFNKSNEMSKGVVLSVNKDTKTGKVHVLGKKAHGRLLRIFELGTYKKLTKAHKQRIPAYEFFTKALEKNRSNIAPAIIENLRELIRIANR